MKASSFITQVHPGFFRITVHAKPGARCSALACRPAITDSALEVRIAAPPLEGKANVELVDFMQTLLEQQLAQTRAAQLHTPSPNDSSSTTDLHKSFETRDQMRHKRRPGKSTWATPIGSQALGHAKEKVRVALVSGATGRHKVLEVVFPGTEEELFSLLQSSGS